METNGSVTIGAGVYMHIKQRGTINEIVFSGNEITHRAVRLWKTDRNREK